MDPVKDVKTAGDATETKEEKDNITPVAASPLAISLEEETAGEAEAGKATEVNKEKDDTALVAAAPLPLAYMAKRLETQGYWSNIS